MIRVHKIAHATYETPDLDQQAEYFTDILGLTLASPRKKTRASTRSNCSILATAQASFGQSRAAK